ncbi:MAG: galactokinase [Deltaproteobacteria bacterium]|nr:galactokinase [Deltaproteobacteria bacterium]MBI3293572.1 galactokinase [Deltaproteobacteria bacterium]
MIITRTPFRFTLGGGGTDLPTYYSRFGGFVVSAAIDKYMFIAVNRPIVDDLVRVKYSASEMVESTESLRHELARSALQHLGIGNGIEVISMADIPAGTGLGSSSCYMVGLLSALYALKRDYRTVAEIAETACHLEMNVLKKPIGKQDQYIAAFGGLTVLDIAKNGRVNVRQANVEYETLDELNRNTLIFYTGKTRQAEEILKDQSQGVERSDALITDSLHQIKEIGYRTLEALESGNVDRFGLLMDDHWRLKLKLSSRIADQRLLRLYEVGKENGALGGKVTGAGGGGFFVFYTNNRHHQLRRAMLAEGLRELRYRFDMEGAKILVNLTDSRGHYEHRQLFWPVARDADHGLSGSC